MQRNDNISALHWAGQNLYLHTTEVTEILLLSSSPAADKGEWDHVSEKWTFPLFNVFYFLMSDQQKRIEKLQS